MEKAESNFLPFALKTTILHIAIAVPPVVAQAKDLFEKIYICKKFTLFLLINYIYGMLVSWKKIPCTSYFWLTSLEEFINIIFLENGQ